MIGDIDLILGDCLEKMKDIPDHSVDMVLCDLPYGVLSLQWDSVIPMDELWEQYNRCVKKMGLFVYLEQNRSVVI